MLSNWGVENVSLNTLNTLKVVHNHALNNNIDTLRKMVSNGVGKNVIKGINDRYKIKVIPDTDYKDNYKEAYEKYKALYEQEYKRRFDIEEAYNDIVNYINNRYIVDKN